MTKLQAQNELVNEINRHCRLRGMDAVEKAAHEFAAACIAEAVAPAIAELEKEERFGMTCAARKALSLLRQERDR